MKPRASIRPVSCQKAHDWRWTTRGDYGQVATSLAWGGQFGGMWAEGIGFMGYPYLAELTQRAEYRAPSEIIAEEMTRKWIRITKTGDEDTEGKIAKLESAMKRFRVREVFRDAIELDGFYGLAFIYIDVGTRLDDEEQRKPLYVSKAKIGKGKLKHFTLVDPTWCAPIDYDSRDPTDPTFYKPQTWFVMGRRIHQSRLLKVLSRPVPDLLKPAYNFGGISLSQMLKPYVDNWLRTRQSVSDLLQAFTVFVLETNMAGILAGGGGEDMQTRFAYFAAVRNNLGLMAVDKDQESLSNVSAPLGTLDHLQAQAQEHMAAVARLPLSKMFGLTPSGLNATLDGEIRVLYDTIHARQERVLGDVVTHMLRVLQLNEFGEIDPSIDYEFVQLWELDEAGVAATDKTNADADSVRIADGVISPEESREVLRKAPGSRYAGITGPAPEPPEEADPDEGGGDPAEKIDNRAVEGGETEANSGV